MLPMRSASWMLGSSRAPFAWQASLMEFARQVREPSLGQLFHLRYRNGHHGPREIGCDPYFTGWLYDEAKNGGGAIADFCGYGAALCRWLMGMPESVYAIRGNFTKDDDVPDDHAVCLLKYPRGSAAIEGTWATFGFDESANPVAHAKRGTVAVYGDRVRIHTADRGSQEVETAAMEIANPAAYFLRCIREGKTPSGMLDPRIAADACCIVDAAKASARSGAAETP
jgi:predicted dehydrogenase